MSCNLSSLTLLTGEATRKGFYVYDDKRKASPDPEIKKYVEQSRGIAGFGTDPEVKQFQC